MNAEAVEIAQRDGHDDDKKLRVKVTYNGKSERIEFRSDETMGALRERAVKAFGSPPNPHTLSLFSEKGEEYLDDNKTVHDAGIRDKDELLLRPSTVRGG